MGAPVVLFIAVSGDWMPALGHKRTFAAQQPMFALLSIATVKADPRKKACPLCPESGIWQANRARRTQWRSN